MASSVAGECAIHCGSTEPKTIPFMLAIKPASWLGNSFPHAGTNVKTSHTPTPNTILAIAPWVVALRQYRPKAKGTKAPTRVIW